MKGAADGNTMDIEAGPPQAWMDAFRTMMQDSLDSKMTPITHAVTQLQRESVETRNAVASLEQRMSTIEKERSEDKVSLCSTSLSTATRDSWTPSKIELRGFCKYEERNERGLTYIEVCSYVNNLRAALPNELQAHVQEPVTHAGKTTSILFAVVPQYIPMIVGLWKTHIATELAGDEKIAGMFVRAELHPTRKAANRLMGRLLRFVEYCVKNKGNKTEGFFAPDFAVYTGSAEPNARAVQVVTFEEENQKNIHWSPTAPQILGMSSIEDVMYAFREHKG
eukprot:TRINITY_DN30132_c0_g1_i1.p1 TRINITY_DN30132_c0_g1~~TRINITY_DN30132_c0_g1_i1.p1  ORF type:complete len:280 (+),score=41.64 TRINITY_DN30132_c0_g1_i1:316-1155(+)